jgi:hypothetical protein
MEGSSSRAPSESQGSRSQGIAVGRRFRSSGVGGLSSAGLDGMPERGLDVVPMAWRRLGGLGDNCANGLRVGNPLKVGSEHELERL